MASTKKSAKTAPGKQPAPAPSLAPARTSKSPAKAKLAVEAKPAVAKIKPATAKTKPAVSKPKPAVKTKAVAKAVVAKAAASEPARSLAKKASVASPEQRRYYVEVAAYHIAERRGFAAGDPLQDWVQAEAEIDRLLAEGLLGR